MVIIVVNMGVDFEGMQGAHPPQLLKHKHLFDFNTNKDFTP